MANVAVKMSEMCLQHVGMDATTLCTMAATCLSVGMPMTVVLKGQRPPNWPLPIDKSKPHVYRAIAVLEWVDEIRKNATVTPPSTNRSK